MSKRTRECSVPWERSVRSRVPSSARHDRHTTSNFPNNKDNMKQWEEARCPVCLEHPHNAVLLICSSYEKGCRPYMCDTSYRHSNCLEQFQKSSAEVLSDAAGQDMPGSSNGSSGQHDSRTPILPGFHKLQNKLTCPHCRGQISGWIVVESARSFMNGKSRSCAHETCDFSGNYTDLRKHARLVHPLVRPSEADPERQRSWRRMVREREIEDIQSMMQSPDGDYSDDEDIYMIDVEVGLTVFFLTQVFQPITRSRSSSGTGTSGSSPYGRGRRRPYILWGERYDMNASYVPGREECYESDGGSRTWRRRDASYVPGREEYYVSSDGGSRPWRRRDTSYVPGREEYYVSSDGGSRPWRRRDASYVPGREEGHESSDGGSRPWSRPVCRRTTPNDQIWP